MSRAFRCNQCGGTTDNAVNNDSCKSNACGGVYRSTTPAVAGTGTDLPTMKDVLKAQDRVDGAINVLALEIIAKGTDSLRQAKRDLNERIADLVRLAIAHRAASAPRADTERQAALPASNLLRRGAAWSYDDQNLLNEVARKLYGEYFAAGVTNDPKILRLKGMGARLEAIAAAPMPPLVVQLAQPPQQAVDDAAVDDATGEGARTVNRSAPSGEGER